jgi:hypothetical protein
MSTAKEVDSNERAYEYIIELCAGNPNKFKANDFGSYQGEVWGKYEGDYVYIIKNIFNREIASAGYNAATFLSWAKRKNLLICDDGKRTKKSRIAGEPVNCVCLRKPDEVQPSVQFDEKVLDNL